MWRAVIGCDVSKACGRVGSQMAALINHWFGSELSGFAVSKMKASGAGVAL